MMVKMEEDELVELPDILFIILHESGIVIYTYPPIKEQQYILSSLISAIFALSSQLSKKERDIVKMNISGRTLYGLREEDIIYSLLVSEKYPIEGNKTLIAMVDEVKKDFPAEMIDGIVKPKDDTTSIDTRLENILALSISRARLERYEPKISTGLSLHDVCQIAGKEKITKIYRCLIAGKNIVIVCYDISLVARVIHTVCQFWPEEIDIVPISEENIDKITKTEKTMIFIVGRDYEKRLSKILPDALFIDFDKPLKEKFKGDILISKIDKILKLESEESRNSMLRSEILSLCTILKDAEKIVSESKEEITIENLKKILAKKHPIEKVEYVVSILTSEKGKILSKIKTPEKILEDVFI